MPVHVEGVDKVASILEQFPIMLFGLPQCYLSTLTLISLHGGEQTMVMPTARESMPDA